MIRTVGLGKISYFPKSGQLSLLEKDMSFSELMAHALGIGRGLPRHQRVWHTSTPFLYNEDYYGAKLGFERVAFAGNVEYDSELCDFLPSSVEYSGGAFSRFVIDLKARRVCFEIKPQIPAKTFLKVMARFLILAHHGLILEPVLSELKFHEWIAKQDRVVRLSLSAHRPNPGFAERHKEIETLIKEGTDRLDVVVEATPAGKLEIENTIYAKLAGYTLDGHGRVNAWGMQGDRSTAFKSRDRIEQRRLMEDVDPNDPDDRQHVSGMMDWARKYG